MNYEIQNYEILKLKIVIKLKIVNTFIEKDSFHFIYIIKYTRKFVV